MTPNNNVPPEQIAWFTARYLMPQTRPRMEFNGSRRLTADGSQMLVITGRIGAVRMDPDSLPTLLDTAIGDAARNEYYELAGMLRTVLNQLEQALAKDKTVSICDLIEQVRRSS